MLCGGSEFIGEMPFEIGQHADPLTVGYVFDLLGERGPPDALDQFAVVLAGRQHRKIIILCDPGFHMGSREEESGHSVAVKKVSGTGRAPEKHVVVEVHEMFGKPGNPVYTRLDRMRVECGKLTGVAEQRVVIDECDVGM